MLTNDVFECQNCGREFSDSRSDGKVFTYGRCGFKFIYNVDTDELIEDYSEVYEYVNDDEVNPMCSACGNPDYPKCMDSCGKLDD